MVELTKFNGEHFTFNAVYIEQVQSTPDTTITTTRGKTFVVKEDKKEVVQKIKRFYREIGLWQVVSKAGEEDV
ncbi:flagellar FlbD family protein [Salimicrobium flavidum]|uniref:Flagellar protein FlbD n=1 Tax=Salimicrobium flavidum TaxID=570947 RepID=A0A1N7IKL3_9BACI|nr:flagellar FlbD family protein [Salimicrobium flavidum]SIS37625.1 flagellar protein FlbD [Salimicrobium flavidum]